MAPKSTPLPWVSGRYGAGRPAAFAAAAYALCGCSTPATLNHTTEVEGERERVPLRMDLGLTALVGRRGRHSTAYARTHSMGVPCGLHLQINALSFVFSAGIGEVFDYFPARRAARMAPLFS